MAACFGTILIALTAMVAQAEEYVGIVSKKSVDLQSQQAGAATQNTDQVLSGQYDKIDENAKITDAYVERNAIRQQQYVTELGNVYNQQLRCIYSSRGICNKEQGFQEFRKFPFEKLQLKK